MLGLFSPRKCVFFMLLDGALFFNLVCEAFFVYLLTLCGGFVFVVGLIFCDCDFIGCFGSCSEEWK